MNTIATVAHCRCLFAQKIILGCLLLSGCVTGPGPSADIAAKQRSRSMERAPATKDTPQRVTPLPEREPAKGAPVPDVARDQEPRIEKSTIVPAPALSMQKPQKVSPRQKLPDGIVKVHFGTNRAPDPQASTRNGPPFFTSDNAQRITYGTLLVTIDPDHQIGEINKSVHLYDPPMILQERKFFEQLSADLAHQPGRKLLVFIHGYNVTFENAAKRTAQIKYDLKFQGETAFFSWPSKGKLLGYWSDETAIREAEPFLEEFLLNIAKKSTAQSIYIIAHSMGNRAFGNVFPKVHQALKGNQSIKEIMLAAPDVDATVFKHEIAPYLTFSNCGTTVYSSGKDKALWGSWLAHGFSSRAGQRVLGLQGLESIDAGTINTSKLGLGHSYYGEQARLLEDLRGLIAGRRPPQRIETLEPFPKKTSAWLLRKN